MKNYSFLIVVLLAFFLPFTSSAQEENKQQSSKQTETKENAVTLKVKGMVCSFCAQGIKKNFSKYEEVKQVDVDLDKMEVMLTFNKGKSLTDSEMKEVITEAGFEYVGPKE